MLSMKTVAITRRTRQWQSHFVRSPIRSTLLLMLLGLLLLQAPERVQMHPLINVTPTIEYRRYCSDRLTDAIGLICGGNTFSLGRKFPDSIITGVHPVLRRFAATDETVRSTSSGSIHECCRRPCGYSELKMYCSDQ